MGEVWTEGIMAGKAHHYGRVAATLATREWSWDKLSKSGTAGAQRSAFV